MEGESSGYEDGYKIIIVHSSFFQRKYNLTQQKGNFDISIIYLMSAGLSPVFGILVDYFGRHIYFVLLAATSVLIGHSLLIFTFLEPLVAMIFVGFGYTIINCSVWPLVSMVVPQHQLGTAFGIIVAIENLFLGSVTLLAGYTVDYYGFIVVEIFFFSWISGKCRFEQQQMNQIVCQVSIFFLIWLYLIDLKGKGRMNLSIQARNKWEELQ